MDYQIKWKPRPYKYLSKLEKKDRERILDKLEEVEKDEIKEKLISTYNSLGMFREAKILEGV